jgi:acyl-CoA synthetase (AMP-forming)/AMP-acid ligase II
MVLLPEIASLHARTHPDKPALICGEAVLAWGALEQAVSAWEAGLRGRGIGRGAVVAVLADPSIAAIVAQLGVLRAGAAVASLPTAAAPDALGRMIANAGPALLIADAPYRHPAESLVPHALPVEQVPPESPVLQPPVAIYPDDPFCILYSSGTTGDPKGVVLSHACRLANATAMAIEMRYDDRAVVLVGTALSSNMSWTLLTTCMLVGGTAVVMRKFDAEQAVRLVARHRVTHTTMVPTQWARMLEAAEASGATLESLRAAVSVGSRIPPALKRRMGECLPGSCFEVYGLTEGLVTILKPEAWEAHIDTVGRPLLGNDIRIIDTEGRALPRGERGEIVGHSPVLMQGYYDDPERTAAVVWRDPASGRGFLRSGDIGFLDGEGYLHLVDRLRDMIISGGANIFPADLEAVLLAHAAVREAAVVGVAHPDWGETPVAVVVGTVEAEALRQWANERLGRHQRLSRVIVRDALPRNAGGKVLKRALREQIEGGVPA